MSLPAKNQKNSFLGLRYIRLLIQKPDSEEIEKLKQKYSYIFIYSYEKPGFKDFKIRAQQSPIIDLSQSLDEIFAKFKKNTRNEIHKTEKIKELKFKNPDENFNYSYRFYRKIKRADGVKPDIKKEFKGCLFFNAYLNKKMIVSVSCYDNGEILRLKHIVSSRKEKNFDGRVAGYATRKIIWEIIKYGKENNYEKMDLAGVNFEDPSKKGITEFKMSFGGEIKDIYICRYETKIFLLLKKILNFLGKNIN